jgi:SAM-dependent methyltransferase
MHTGTYFGMVPEFFREDRMIKTNRSSMITLEESVVRALDGSDTEIYPYLPSILQDIWELGADPEIIIRLLENHFGRQSAFTVLDPGCGKGAVSIQVAAAFGCRCHGIDAIPGFITEAQKKAIEYKVGHLCQFETGDIREKVKQLTGYDVIILGAIGPVFGNYHQTLNTLSGCLTSRGIIITDDGYIDDNSGFSHPMVLKREEILQQTDAAGFRITAETVIGTREMKESNTAIFGKLEQRCHELIARYPDKEELFTGYIRKQKEENEAMENIITCATMVFSRKEA